MIDQTAVRKFLAGRRIAVVGASDDQKSFGRTIYTELRGHGYETFAVNPNAVSVAGDTCYQDLASVPGELDGVVVMVHRDKAADVVRSCITRGVGTVWLFKGIGGAGAVAEEAVNLCEENGLPVVAGACPLMFLEPVAWFHQAHRALRRLNGSLAEAPQAVNHHRRRPPRATPVLLGRRHRLRGRSLAHALRPGTTRAALDGRPL